MLHDRVVIEYQLVGADLGEVRFAISPLNELTLSLRALKDPGRFPLHLPWLRKVDGADLDRTALLALTNDLLWTPDFLNPRPRTPLARLEAEFDAVASTPPAQIKAGLEKIHGTALPPPLGGDPTRVRDRILNALHDYWSACFAPHWTRMATLLEADIVHRGHVIVQQGLAEMVAGLSPRVRLNDDVLQIRLRTSFVHYRRPTTGDGLTLVPTLFTRYPSAPVSATEPPVLFYPARGLGTLWAESDAVRAPEAIAGLIGAARARLLVLLTTPASSTELAHRLGVTTTAVNQHLRAMRAAGLLASARQGRSVVYRRTELGDRLLGLPQDSPASGPTRH